MENKLTLITPPDFYENGNLGIMLISMTELQQGAVSEWLAKSTVKRDLNLYTYQGENTMEWLLYALARSDYTYINLDSDDVITNIMASYILSRPNVFFSTTNNDIKNLVNYLNNNYVDNIEQFFERVLSEQQ
jgi:hypothetical protein